MCGSGPKSCRCAINTVVKLLTADQRVNYVRPHQTLTKASGAAGNRYPTTPAMAAGLATEPWTIERMIAAVLGESN